MEELLQAQKDGVAIGLEGMTGIKARLDIDEMLSKQESTFNLFLLALKELQEDLDTTKLMEYFQIAGSLTLALVDIAEANRPRNSWPAKNGLERRESSNQNTQ